MPDITLNGLLKKLDNAIISKRKLFICVNSDSWSASTDTCIDDYIVYDDSIELTYGNSCYTFNVTNVEYDADEECYSFDNNACVFFN